MVAAPSQQMSELQREPIRSPCPHPEPSKMTTTLNPRPWDGLDTKMDCKTCASLDHDPHRPWDGLEVDCKTTGAMQQVSLPLSLPSQSLPLQILQELVLPHRQKATSQARGVDTLPDVQLRGHRSPQWTVDLVPVEVF